jgi:quercetin dioxygenase-like cupin family protein
MLGRNADIKEEVITSVEGLPLTGTARLKQLLVGDDAMLLELRHSKGMTSVEHIHDHDSYCFLVSGRMRTVVDGVEYIMEPGDAVLHPDGVPHSAEALEDCLWLSFKTSTERVW